jgi:hypothetical protein
MVSETSDLLTILTIIIGLSAYLSAIRLAAIQKISEITGSDGDAKTKRWKIKKKLAWLTLADVPTVLSAFCLSLHVFWSRFFCGTPWQWLLPAAFWLFLIGGFMMIILHGVAWMKTILEIYQGTH